MSDDFGRLLRKYRERAGLTQRELRQKLEDDGYELYSEANVSKWENGRTTPSEAMIETLEDILHAPKGLLLDAAGKYEVAEYRRISDKEEDIEEQPLTKEGREYDIKVFKKLDNIMNDKDFWEYFYKLKVGHQIYNKKAEKLAKYCYYTQFESSKHVYPMLRTLFDDFLKKFEDLERHIAPHSFSTEGMLDLIEVNPYVHRKYWSAREVEEFTNKFLELIDIAEAAYIRYRAAVRESLYI